MKIAGVWSGHDTSFCILEDGIPILHAELERYNREKEPQGDSILLMNNVYPQWVDCDAIVTTHPLQKILNFKGINLIKDKKVHAFGHHICHAAHAFFSSDFKKSKIFTIDGGGIEDEYGKETATTVWDGDDINLNHIHTYKQNEINIGGLWTRVTRYIFELQNGWPLGHQAGTIMAMSALGNPDIYHDDFLKMLTSDLIISSHKPQGQPLGQLIIGKDPIHPYLEKWRQIANRSEQDRFDLAAGLQSATELSIKQLIEKFITSDDKNICIAGGVSLNAVAMGKIYNWFPNIENVFIPCVPYDAGLCIGAAQYLYHAKLKNKRVSHNLMSPYLGEVYTNKSINDALDKNKNKITISETNDNEVIDLLACEKIISIFRGGSESGRRALGNRSIFADPRSQNMKSIVNEKVKHRQAFRPFAPVLLRSDVQKYFEKDIDSPYMGLVIKFKEEARLLLPAVVHIDGTARLQTVTENTNSWLFKFLNLWKEKTGISILLNTSFNDREPIVETPTDAIRCFLSTDIDFLYFVDAKVLVSKRKS